MMEYTTENMTGINVSHVRRTVHYHKNCRNIQALANNIYIYIYMPSWTLIFEWFPLKTKLDKTSDFWGCWLWWWPYLFNDDLNGSEYMASNDMMINVEIPRACRPLNTRQWAGHVVRIDGSRIPQIVMGISEKEGQWGNPAVEEMMLVRVTPCIRSRYGTGRGRQEREKAGGRWSGRPWPENGWKRHHRSTNIHTYKYQYWKQRVVN